MGWKGTLALFLVFVAWFVLNRWVLPRCGVSTCCCPIPPPTQRVSVPDSPPHDVAPRQNDVTQKGDLP